LSSTEWHSQRQKVLDKEIVADVQFTEPYLPSVILDKAFAECFTGFAECFSHSAKKLFPVVKRNINKELKQALAN
jgi:hypothetical protein